MQPKERMLRALRREKPDRLPVTIHQWQQYHLDKYMDGMDALEETIARTKQNLKHDISVLGVLVTKFRRGTTVHTELLQQLKDYWEDKIFDTVIHINIDVAAAAMDELPLVVFKPESTAGKDYISLAEEVVNREK